jgi:hypothetical protein
LVDASIAAYDSKYTYDFWRPVTAIRLGDTDGNSATTADPEWSPLLDTPPDPGYVSGQSAFAGAAEIVLGQVFGAQFQPTLANDAGGTRQFDNLGAAAEEAGRSQVYAGTTFEFDNQRGLTMGRDVGRLVLQIFA